MKRAMMIVAAVLLAGCATTKNAGDTAPDWLQGRSAKFPQARYLTGQGEASNAAMARDRARADLIKIFQAKIAEVSRESSSATRDSMGGKVSRSSAMTAERNLSVSSARTIEGIDIGQVWEDKKRKTFHALAVLDRLKAGQALRAEITRLDTATAGELEQARGAGDLLIQIAAALRATEAQAERAALQRDLRVIDISGVGVPPKWELGRLESNRDQLTKRLRLSAQADNDPVGNLDTLLAGAIARAGFKTASKQDATYHLTASLLLDESRIKDWFWAKGELQLTLRDKAGNVRGDHRFPVKASAQQAVIARQRVMGAADRILRAKLRDAILGINNQE